jgi:hypothetical protein
MSYVIAAPSAGANIGMAAVEYEIVNGMPIPGAMVLLSPPVDTSWSNPAVPSIKGSEREEKPSEQSGREEKGGKGLRAKGVGWKRL